MKKILAIMYAAVAVNLVACSGAGSVNADASVSEAAGDTVLRSLSEAGIGEESSGDTLRRKSLLSAVTGNGTVYIGMPEADLLDPKGSALVRKIDGAYRIGNVNVLTYDGRVSEIYIESSPD